MNPQRLNAIKQGLTTFEPGQPCKHGHDSPRYTRSGQCVTCSKETSRKAYHDMIALMPAATYNPKPAVVPKPAQAKPTPQPKAKPAPKPIVKKPENVSDQVWVDFQAHRNGKKAAITQTALDGFIREAEKAGIGLDQAMRASVENNWIGFKADWLKNCEPDKPLCLAACSGRVRDKSDTRFVPCEKPGSFKWGMKSLCASCHEEALQNKTRHEARLEGKA